MTALGDARTRVLTLLQAIDSDAGTLECHPGLPGSVDPPAAVVWPDTWNNPATLQEAGTDVRLRCRLFVQAGELDDAQGVLEGLIDDATDALATDTQIGPVAGENYGLSEWGGESYLTADLVFQVFA